MTVFSRPRTAGMMATSRTVCSGHGRSADASVFVARLDNASRSTTAFRTRFSLLSRRSSVRQIADSSPLSELRSP
eukprot:scaffold3978_cov291-Pinguiococcus_pyrenoidosus.AAC.18